MSSQPIATTPTETVRSTPWGAPTRAPAESDLLVPPTVTTTTTTTTTTTEPPPPPTTPPPTTTEPEERCTPQRRTFDEKEQAALFEYNKSDLRPEGERLLLAFIEELFADYERPRLHFEGHTDTSGDSEYNRQLSVDRARTIHDWFLALEQFNEGDLTFEGFGEAKPRFPDDKNDQDKAAQNRRVEIEITATVGCPD